MHDHGAEIIGLIDGTFHQNLSVWHNEVCYVLSRGVAVFGASFPLLVLAIGFARILISFIFQTLLRSADIPRILADVLFALVLLIYALFRLHDAGVNPTSLGLSGASALIFPGLSNACCIATRLSSLKFEMSV